MSLDRIELQERTPVSSDIPSIFYKFPIIRVQKQNGENENLLLYLFQINNKPDYLVLGKFPQDLLSTLNSNLFQEWLTHLDTMLRFDLLGSTAQLEAEYLKEMATVEQSYFAQHIEWTQEGFDLISGKQNFSPKGTLQRTVVLDTEIKDQSLLFGASYYSLFPEESLCLGKLFASFQDYTDNYFLNQNDLQDMSFEQASAFALFHRYRIVKYIRNHRHGEGWMEAYCHEALSPNLEQSEISVVQLLDSIVEMQHGKKILRAHGKEAV